ncbi:hypothetical protein RvY_12411 [Ramazzottius varieornatus]|uniref:Uncharacterized protein n=1 Tax=Ramazzottius varieornatus TaxID=947166 RepID=A0A1D1VJF5_RAMVA|nr:hypothetical protein RvY_12411 [Ramazzottius varieornatus]
MSNIVGNFANQPATRHNLLTFDLLRSSKYCWTKEKNTSDRREPAERLRNLLASCCSSSKEAMYRQFVSNNSGEPN